VRERESFVPARRARRVAAVGVTSLAPQIEWVFVDLVGTSHGPRDPFRTAPPVLIWETQRMDEVAAEVIEYRQVANAALSTRALATAPASRCPRSRR